VNPGSVSGTELRPRWEGQMEDAEWAVYQRVMEEARAGGIRFAFGGAFATAVYTGQLRNTKDFDFYILPDDRGKMIEAIARAGLQDHYHQLPYDKVWIYRASSGDVIVDAIWAMANLRALVDERWLSAGPEVHLRGEIVRAIPIEELIWSKLYVLQRQRCDWVDVLNLIDSCGESIDWNYLVDRLEADAPLLAGALAVFAWLAPDRSSTIPTKVRDRLGLVLSENGGSAEVSERAGLLDSRPWFRAARNG
jgi:hypothetical protein